MEHASAAPWRESVGSALPTTSPSGAAPDGPGSSSKTPTQRQAPRLVDYHFDSPHLGPVPVVVRVPEHLEGERVPALVLLHGRGEALKRPERGARGYLDDYALETAWRWLQAPKHERPPKELPSSYQEEVKRGLREKGLGEMVLVFPYVPDRFRGPEAFVSSAEYARLLTDVMARVKAELPVRQDAAGWALDGISLGGRVALACSAHLATRMGAIGSVQAAIDERELGRFADILAEARRANPALRHTLATSEHDYFRAVLERHHRQLSERGLEHEWIVLPGDHSYAFNRGPGVVHLLTTYGRWFTP